MKHQKIRIFNINIDNVVLQEAVQLIGGFIESGKKHFITTPNVDHIVRLHRDRDFLAVYQKASLTVADGMPILWSSRLLGKPLKGRVAGSDLIVPICKLAAQKGYGVYFLGGEPGVAEKAAEALMRLSPTLRIAGCCAPPFGFESDEKENQKLIRVINQSGADILFVALGAPKQEKWIAKHLPYLHVKVGLCIGAGLDFLAGKVHRAPAWMREIGFEWFWRLCQDPKRLWKRYLINDWAFVPILLRELRRSRSGTYKEVSTP